MDLTVGIVIGLILGVLLSIVSALVSIYISLQSVGIVAQAGRLLRPKGTAVIVEKTLVNQEDEGKDIPISELL